jgi:hypothetical protein
MSKPLQADKVVAKPKSGTGSTTRRRKLAKPKAKVKKAK